MNKSFFLILLLLPFTALSIDQKKGKLITPGRWREVKRITPDSAMVNFSDTLFIAFMPKDSFAYRHRKGFIYEGIYTISEDSILNFGTSAYKVIYKRPSLMVLVNQAGIFHLEPDQSEVIKAITIKKDDTARPVASIDQMIGHWTVYKRASAGEATVDMAENIRSAYITGPSTDGKLGYLYGGNDADNDPSWYIKAFNTDQTLSCEGRKPRTIKVVKCQDGEMILEEGGISYYFKQFR